MTKWKTHLPFIYRDKRTYQWRTDGVRWELLAGRRVVATVLPDLTYRDMWRVDLGDGVLSDMVNLPRAKDAAVRMADAREMAGKTLISASPMRLQGQAGNLLRCKSIARRRWHPGMNIPQLPARYRRWRIVAVGAG